MTKLELLKENELLKLAVKEIPKLQEFRAAQRDLINSLETKLKKEESISYNLKIELGKTEKEKKRLSKLSHRLSLRLVNLLDEREHKER